MKRLATTLVCALMLCAVSTTTAARPATLPFHSLTPRTQRVELGFYGYLNGTRFMQMLGDAAPGQPIDCELRMTNQGLFARAGGASHGESGSMGVSLPLTWVLHSAYFGGDETAPHQIHVSVSNVSAP